MQQIVESKPLQECRLRSRSRTSEKYDISLHRVNSASNDNVTCRRSPRQRSKYAHAIIGEAVFSVWSARTPSAKQRSCKYASIIEGSPCLRFVSDMETSLGATEFRSSNGTV
jgi:hypothetical protein